MQGDRFGDRYGDRFGDRFGDRSGDRFGDRSLLIILRNAHHFLDNFNTELNNIKFLLVVFLDHFNFLPKFPRFPLTTSKS